MKTNYFPQEFDQDVRTSLALSSTAPWFRLKTILPGVREDSRSDFVACMYLAVLLDQTIATYDLGRRPRFELSEENQRRPDRSWNVGRGSGGYPKYGPCGISRAHEHPHVLFVESCEAGVHSINELKERLLADFGVLLPHAGTFVQRTGSSASAAHVFSRIYRDPHVRSRECAAKSGKAGFIKWSVFSALYAHRSLVLPSFLF
jgi:hypothetical protein